MSENYEKVVSDLSMMIEQFSDIPNSLFSDDINWGKTNIGYDKYAKSLAIKYGQD